MRLYLSSFRLGNRPQRMLDLLRGGTRAAVVGNADDYKDADLRATSVEREMNDLRGLGLTPVEVDLRHYFDRPDALRSVLDSVDLIWVRGGNPFILRRAMTLTGADEILRDLLAEDRVVYAGYSAGICVLTPSLHGLELVDDPHDVPAGYPEEIVWDCLGLLPYSILPHHRSDHPESALIDKSLEYMVDHHMPFVALRDGQALVIDGDDQEVAG
ncbi:Type 1 glutamine amidotransferase-like domain-containing protein [Micromonospora sp. CPCC 205546]|uniref:Type 1 glutamine amidotransferase-like domain-containing protein n=1 Tax=Micromonospora sp. CPCC 205546 TaxID=3122397 RepID=UPI002FF08EE7